MKYQPETKEQLKALCDDLKVNLGDIDTSKITDMSGLFMFTERTNEQFSGIENWNVSNVKDMSNMFAYNSFFNQPIGNWDVSNVTDMNGIFAQASSFNQSLTNWQINDECDVDYFSFFCPIDSDLTKLPKSIAESRIKFAKEHIDCKDLLTSNSKYFENWKINDNLFNHLDMFYNDDNADNKSLPIHQVVESYLADNKLSLSPDEIDDTILAYKVSFTASALSFDPPHNMIPLSCYAFPASRWKEFIDACGNCKTAQDCMEYAHSAYYHLEKKYTPENKEELKALCNDLKVNLGDIDTSKITDMSYLFAFSSRSNKQFEGIEKWDVSNVTNLTAMFLCARKFNQPLDKWNVSNVTKMREMFHEARNFNQNIENWDVSNVTDMIGMFEYAKKFNQSLDAWTINDECFISSFARKCPIENDLTKLPKALVEDLIKQNDETYTQEQLDAVAEKFSLDISYIKPKPQIEDLIEENSISR